MIVTTSSPPGIATRTGLEHQPRATATAATATADEPDAAVSPAPRSQTSTETLSGGSGMASCTFVRRGKRGCVSMAGPRRNRSSRESASRSTTACGLPTSAVTMPSRSPATSSTSSSPTETSAKLLADHVGRSRNGANELALGLDLDFRQSALPEQPRGGDASAVAGELRGRAVGIPDADDRASRIPTGYLQQPVAADPGVDVAEPADTRRRASFRRLVAPREGRRCQARATSRTASTEKATSRARRCRPRARPALSCRREVRDRGFGASICADTRRTGGCVRRSARVRPAPARRSP